MNTLLLESGEWNVYSNPDEWNAISLDRGRFVQTGGNLAVSGSAMGLWIDNNAYASHAAKLMYLNIQNEYHGTKLDEILQNDIVVDYQMGTIAINETTSTKAYNYFPEYSGFFFTAEFEESHSDGCCEEEEETSRSISARVEAYGTRGQSVSVPPRYNVEMGRFEGWYEFLDWVPEAFAVYWVEESIVNRESFYQAAIDDMSTYDDAGWRYEDVLTNTTDEVNNTMVS